MADVIPYSTSDDSLILNQPTRAPSPAGPDSPPTTSPPHERIFVNEPNFANTNAGFFGQSRHIDASSGYFTEVSKVNANTGPLTEAVDRLHEINMLHRIIQLRYIQNY
jgi:hypothetical protein